ncbi:MAG: hypothetical protein JJE17_07605 [Peptostreptococcaceae bacterium]|nr:hypothetical protein [Peptostreptococcaceae bacterium]
MHSYEVETLKRKNWMFWLSVLSLWIFSLISKFVDIISIWISDVLKLPSWITFSFSAILLFSVLWLILNNWIWKCRIVRRFLKIPNFTGHWLCEGLSQKYMETANGEKEFPWNGDVHIDQKFDSILITLTTPSSSRSVSQMAFIQMEGNQAILSYMYENQPNSSNSDLHIHKGFCRLIFDEKNQKATGTYYTDNHRGSSGTMQLRREK